ncbi:unnamed protein product [Dicrocoelium dendriticum]|nr:unnamed protein product [Dicrocoelium dendriticum]
MFAIDRPKLSELFVFSPTLCQKEGDEHKKLLYYYPPDKSLNTRLNSIGLCEALLTFSKFFDSSCHSLHTSMTRRFFYRISEAVWAVMVVALPSHKTSAAEYSTYHERDCNLHDQVMRAVLSTACETFELFNGRIDALLQSEDVDILRLRLDHFFSRVYLRLMLFEHCDILNCFNGIQFTSTEPADFARVQGFVNRVKFAFRCIEHLAFFYDGRLVYATLDPEYARHLYHYLNSFLFSEQPDLTHTAATTMKHLGRYLVGPKVLDESKPSVLCPLLCSPNSSTLDCQLVTYQALRASVCLIVRGTYCVLYFFPNTPARYLDGITLIPKLFLCWVISVYIP